MNNPIHPQPLSRRFRQFLVRSAAAGRTRLSAATVKNYVSDTDQFLRWLARRLQVETVQPIQLTGAVFADYLRRLNDPHQPIGPATAERRLSSLKRFGRFLHAAGMCDIDPAAGLAPAAIRPTIARLISGFKAELKRQKLSPSTIKNYVSDVYNYLLWANENIKITDRNLLKL